MSKKSGMSKGFEKQMRRSISMHVAQDDEASSAAPMSPTSVTSRNSRKSLSPQASNAESMEGSKIMSWAISALQKDERELQRRHATFLEELGRLLEAGPSPPTAKPWQPPPLVPQKPEGRPAGYLPGLVADDDDDDDVDEEKPNSPPFSRPTTAETGEQNGEGARSTQISLLHGSKQESGNAIEQFVMGSTFENIFVFFILFNTTVMALEGQYNGDVLGHRLGYGSYGQEPSLPSDAWPSAPMVLICLEWVFGIVFTLELVFKLIGYKKDFFYSPWNYLDATVVFFFVLWAIIELSGVKFLPDSVSNLTRLARLLRILKLLRAMQDFEALYLMITSLLGSMQVLGWSMVLLFLLKVLFALTLQTLCLPYLSDPLFDAAAKEQLFMYFGSFTRSVLTVFEMTFGNWYSPCRVMMENCGEWYMLIFLFHLLFIGFAVIAVLNGVFINETFKVAENDDKFMLMREQREEQLHTKKMKFLFDMADTDGGGSITSEEFKVIFENDEVKQWLAAMQMSSDDIGGLFDMIDVDGDGDLTLEELVHGVGQLKGPAKAYDLAEVKQRMVKLEKNILAKLGQTSTQPVTGEQLSHARVASPHRYWSFEDVKSDIFSA